MIERVGLKLFEPEEIKAYEGTLKHDLLFFDKILFDPGQFENNLHLAELLATPAQTENLRLFAADVAYLEKAGALFPVPFAGFSDFLPGAAEEIATLEEKIEALTAEAREGEDLERVTTDSGTAYRSKVLTLHFHQNKLCLLRARNISLESTEDGVIRTTTTPTLSRSLHFLDFGDPAYANLGEGNVMSVVHKAIPLPKDDVPIERILDFARDGRTRTHFAQLQKWVVDMEAADVDLVKVCSDMDAALKLYGEHCEAAKLEFERKASESIIAVSLDVLTNLVKLKPSAAVKSIFSFREARQKLSAAELMSPGREVAFIHHARQALSNLG